MPDEKKPDDSLDENLKPEDQEASNDAADEPSSESAADIPSEDVASADVEAESDSSVAVDEMPVDGEGADGSDESVEAGLNDGAEADDADKVINPDDASEDDAEAAMMKMLEEEVEAGVSSDSSLGGDDFPDLSGIKMEPTANPAEFQQLTPTSSGDGSQKNIDMLLDVKMPISIELGRTEMAISELLTLGPGSVVELNKLAGEPVDLLVNDKIIARGEVVVVDENFGVRITLLMSPEERLKSLAQA